MAQQRAGNSAQDSRAGVVRARLTNLMAVLNESGPGSLRVPGAALRSLPSVPGPRPCNERMLPRAVPGDALGRVIDCVVPTGLMVVHGRCLPDGSVSFEHIVVSRRGLVVVAPSWAAGDGTGERRSPAQCSQSRSGAQRHQRAGRPDRRSELVRSVLRKSCGLRDWLQASAWEEVPVLAAVCTEPSANDVVPPPVVLDGLWVGAVERLPSWLASGSALTAAERAAISYYLISELAELAPRG